MPRVTTSWPAAASPTSFDRRVGFVPSAEYTFWVSSLVTPVRSTVMPSPSFFDTMRSWDTTWKLRGGHSVVLVTTWLFSSMVLYSYSFVSKGRPSGVVPTFSTTTQ